MELSVISYNVHSCVGSDNVGSVERVSKSLVRGMMDKKNVCAIGLQEVEANDEWQQTRVWSESHSDDQPQKMAEYLAEATGEPWQASFEPAIRSVASSWWSEKHGTGNGQFGIAILTKYPVLQRKQVTFAKYKLKTLRNAMACLLQLPDSNGTLWIVNTHLGCHFTGDEQYQQSLQLASFLQSLCDQPDTPADLLGIILCGDFNAPSFFQAPSVITQKAAFIDTWQQQKQNSSSNKQRGATFPSTGLPGLSSYLSCFPPPMMKLDYIFYKPTSSHDQHQQQHQRSITCTHTSVINREYQQAVASDHLPLLAVFTVLDSSQITPTTTVDEIVV